MADRTAFVDEVANELRTWPGVRLELDPGETLRVLHHHDELGVLHREEGTAEFRRLDTAEHNELVEHGEAEPEDPDVDPEGVVHDLNGPSDITAVLELFDRRYREVRGEA
jgi:hypothetical protein